MNEVLIETLVPRDDSSKIHEHFYDVPKVTRTTSTASEPRCGGLRALTRDDGQLDLVAARRARNDGVL